MNETPERVGGDQTQQPQNQEDYSYRPQKIHICVSPLRFPCRPRIDPPEPRKV